MRLEATTKAGPAAAARVASRFQVAWMNAARTTSASGSSDMRPPCRKATKKISTSPPLGFCPSGAAACYRGFRNARTGDGLQPPGTLVATQSIGRWYRLDSRHRQPKMALDAAGDCRVGGEQYDREWPERARQTMW